MVKTRRILLSDFDDAIFAAEFAELSRSFFLESGAPGELHFGSFLTLWKKMIMDGTAVMFGQFKTYDDENLLVGVLGGVLAPNMFTGGIIASELFWYVLKEHRARGSALLKQFIDWGRTVGVDQLMMGHLHFAVSERVSALYDRLGFKKLETMYSLKL